MKKTEYEMFRQSMQLSASTSINKLHTRLKSRVINVTCGIMPGFDDATETCITPETSK